MARYGYMPNNQVTINRGSIEELDAAIADLEERGYEVVKRDTESSVEYNQVFNTKDSRGSRYKYTGEDVSMPKCKAVMVRKEPYVQT